MTKVTLNTKDEKNTPFSPRGLVKKIIDSNFDDSNQTVIDDRDVPKAPNWLEWCIGKQFLNDSVLSRQVQIATVFFGEYCPRCSKPGFIDDLFKQSVSDIRENAIILEFGVCPRCGVTQTELFKTKELKECNELNCVIGRRGGKSALVSMIGSYHLHRIVTLSNPSKYYGILSNDTLSFLFLAVTMKQAHQTLWDKFTARIDSSVWFKSYHSFLAAEAKRKSIPVTDILKYSTTELAYLHKSIHCSAYAPNFNTFRGYTAAFAAIDELGFFDLRAAEHRVTANAEETYGSCDISCQSIRKATRHLRHDMNKNFVPTGINCNISSPSAPDDMIMRLYKSAPERPSSYGCLYPTWEANPQFTRESIWEEMLDKKKFYRDYACTPAYGGEDVFLAEEQLVNRCINKEKENLLPFSVHTIPDAIDPNLQTMYTAVHLTSPERKIPRILGVDMGYSNNSFALVLSSYNAAIDTIEVDGIIECEPIKINNGQIIPVNIPKMFDETIIPILKNFNVIYVVYDRWSSIDAIQRIRSQFKINAEQFTLKHEHFSVVKTMVYDGKLRIPKPEVSVNELQKYKLEDVIKTETPATNLHYQMLTVREIAGRKITKPFRGNDDIFRAMALTVTYIRNPELTSKFISFGSNMQAQKARGFAGSVKLASGGGTVMGNFNNKSSVSNMGVVKLSSSGRRR